MVPIRMRQFLDMLRRYRSLIIEVETNGGQVTTAFNLVGTAVTLDEIACPVLQRIRGALGSRAEEHIAKLRAYTEILRNMAFQGVILSSGNICRSVTHSFIRGSIPDGTVFVTVRCQDGDDYVIMENGIDEGAMVLTCAESSAIFLKMGVFDNCWTPIRE